MPVPLAESWWAVEPPVQWPPCSAEGSRVGLLRLQLQLTSVLRCLSFIWETVRKYLTLFLNVILHGCHSCRRRGGFHEEEAKSTVQWGGTWSLLEPLWKNHERKIMKASGFWQLNNAQAYSFWSVSELPCHLTAICLPFQFQYTTEGAGENFESTQWEIK